MIEKYNCIGCDKEFDNPFDWQFHLERCDEFKRKKWEYHNLCNICHEQISKVGSMRYKVGFAHIECIKKEHEKK